MFVISSNLTTREPEVGRIFHDLKASGWDMKSPPAKELVDMVKRITAAGASAIEINTQQHFDTSEAVKFAVDLIERNSKLPVCLSTNNPEALEAGLHASNRPPIINYLSFDVDRLRDMLPMTIAHNAAVIFMVSDPGAPSDIRDMVEKTAILLGISANAGIPNSRVIFDPGLIHVTSEQGQRHLVEMKQFINILQDAFDDDSLRSTCWLHNSSAGASEAIRTRIEMALLPMLVGAGLSTVFMDVLKPDYVRLLRMMKIFNNETLYADAEIE